MLLSLVMLITSTIGTTYGYLVTKTDSITGVFVPKTPSVSALTIGKTVEHPLGDGYKIPNTIRFDFKVELGAYYANAKLNTTLGEMTADANGILTASIKPFVNFVIQDLEVGTVVKVTEQATTLDGFTVKGESTKTVTVASDGSASLTFVNTYVPDAVKPQNVTVNGIKLLGGREFREGDSFSFMLEQQNGESWTALGTKTVTYDANDPHFNEFDFSDIFRAITFDKVGIYSFRMTEIIGSLDNVDYDRTVNRFTVLVTDVDMDGSLEINTVTGTDNVTVTGTNGAYTVSVTFNNTFIPPVLPDPSPIQVQLDINKTMTNTGELTIGPKGFEFVLENLLTHQKLATVTDDDGEAFFLLSFTKSDIGKTFTYTITETDKGQSGVTYDDDIVEIEITITRDANNTLVASLKQDGVSTNAITASFENIYHADRPVSPPTSDTNLTFWFAMMIVSGSTFVALLVYEKKRVRVQ